MEDDTFVIHRGTHPGLSNELLRKLVMIERTIHNKPRFLMLLSTFRHTYPDFEYDTLLTTARLYYLQDNISMVKEIFKQIKNRMLNIGKSMLKARIVAYADAGSLDIIPMEVLERIV